MQTNILRFFSLILLVGFISSCGSGTNSQSENEQNNTTHLIDPAAAGNGVWNYSVATDYYYGTQESGLAPSLKYDLSQYQTTAIQYAFPVFGNLTLNGTNSSYSTTCNVTNVDFWYYALPQIKNNVADGVDNYLGDCVNGESVTSYYSAFMSHVVPVVEYDGSFLAPLTVNQTSMLNQIADTVAFVINNDPNAYGVAFDNEPSINSQAKDPSVGALNEQAFFGELAYKLAESHKYLFLFDAPGTGIFLHKNGYNGAQLNNIILFEPLYDLEDVGNYPNGPVSVESYIKDASHVATSDLNSANSAFPPIMFVLPASSTSTIWNYLQGYNMVPTESSYVNPTTVMTGGQCNVADATTLGSIDNNVLSLFICSSTGDCPGVVPNIYIESFLSTPNCVNYNNDNHVMNDYFTQALAIVESAATQYGTVNQRYLGSALYAWRISAYNDIACAIHYYSVEDTPQLYSLCTQQFPAEISSTVWNAFNTWGWPN